jgi:hypothetical protein
MIDFRCPGCRAQLQITNVQAGKRKACPECERVFTVPRPGARTRLKRPPKRRSPLAVVLSLVGGLLLVGSAGTALAVYLSHKSRGPVAALAPEPPPPANTLSAPTNTLTGEKPPADAAAPVQPSAPDAGTSPIAPTHQDQSRRRSLPTLRRSLPRPPTRRKGRSARIPLAYTPASAWFRSARPATSRPTSLSTTPAVTRTELATPNRRARITHRGRIIRRDRPAQEGRCGHQGRPTRRGTPSRRAKSLRTEADPREGIRECRRVIHRDRISHKDTRGSPGITAE